MEREVFCDAEKVLPNEMFEDKVENHDQGKVSLNTCMGYTNAYSTIKIVGWTKKHQFMVFIDSGSTHSFVAPQLIKITGSSIELLSKTMKVKVDNGHCVWTKQFSK